MTRDDDSIQSLGGKNRASRLTPERRRAIATNAAQTRWRDHQPKLDEHIETWGNIRRAIAQGELNLGGLIIPCAVLDDGTRVLTEKGLGDAFDRRRGGKDWQNRREAAEKSGELPYFLATPNLKPFVDNELDIVGTAPIRYKSDHKVTFGVTAEIIPGICDVYLKARDAGILRKSQLKHAQRAQIIQSGLARVAIVALVDEATGYQEKRAKDELQKILAAYISPSLLPWSERFPIDFFKEMFRVWGWPWPADEAAYKGPQGPRYAGKLIKQLVLENLPQGVLDELERRNPPNEKWQRRNRMAQLLTEDIGHPHVEKLVANITMLFRLSDNRQDFWRHYTRAFNKPAQLELILEE